MNENPDRQRTLAGRPLTHPDVAHLEAIIENNKRNCAAIDKILFTKPYKTQITQREVKTAHDIAASNPLLRQLLRSMQK